MAQKILSPALASLRHLSVFRNSLFLSKVICNATQRSIVSAIPDSSGLTIYDIDAWNSDEWDPTSFSRPYDFSRPFFAQFREVMNVVPFPSLGVARSTLENADYTNDISHAKNCYLVFGATNNEDCLFSQWLWNNRDVVDCTNVFESERCYDSVFLRKCYHVLYSQYCRECVDSFFLSHCIGCTNCFGCSGLTHKRFCFWNEQLTEKEYQQRVAELRLSSRSEVASLRQRAQQIWIQFPGVDDSLRGSETCTGKNVLFSHGCKNSYFLEKCDEVSDSIAVVSGKSSQLQLSYGDGSENIYFSTGIGDNAYDIRFSWECWMNVSSLEYCMYCVHGVSNCFGCIGLRRAEYCILNRPYSKSEYLELLPRIKAHMSHTGEYGSFFPHTFSPHPYNESWASMFFPCSREKTLREGFRWKDELPIEHISISTPPDDLRDIDPSLLTKTFTCRKTGKPFKLTPPELAWYQREEIPPPEIAPLERIKSRQWVFHL